MRQVHSNLLGLNVSAGDGEVAQLTCYFFDYGVARLLGAIAGLLLVSLMRAAPPPPRRPAECAPEPRTIPAGPELRRAVFYERLPNHEPDTCRLRIL